MVSSRSKTAAEAAANKRTTRSAAASGAVPKVADISTALQLQENVNKKKVAPKKSVTKPPSSKAPVSTASPATKPPARSKKNAGGAYCLCNGEDDGSPMIKCEGGCQNWYHFRCIELDEGVAGEIEKYYCPDCETRTGFKTVSKLDFEGSDAFVDPPPSAQQATRKGRSKTPAEEIDVVMDSPEESDGAGSEDDYVDEPSHKRSRLDKRIVRQPSDFLKSESEDEDIGPDSGRRRRASKAGRLKRLKKVSASPAPESSTVFKGRSSSTQQQAPKRSNTAESAQDDAIRKYCLSKLEEIIRPMFEEYRNTEAISQSGSQTKGEEGNENEEPGDPSASTEDERNVLEQKVKAFVNELECCMMEAYAEPDKTGKPSAGGKYKERFRMLHFNLPKRDRVAVRKGIASGRITPAQLNVMSSTDLADEQTKHEIEIAEKEALEHSILQKVTAPRAKITHKGLETIEDMSGQRAADAAREEEEQRMEREKREREKLARLRSLSLRQGSPTSAVQQSPLSATFPKTSTPTAASTSGLQQQQPWAAPQPNTTQEQRNAMLPPSPATSRPSVRPLFMPSMGNDVSSSEQGLSLADIMNIDDDPAAKDAPPSNPQQRMSEQTDSSPSPVITTPSGPSPFAPSKPSSGSSRRPSFDLHSLWTGPDGQGSPGDDAMDGSSAGVPEYTQTTDDAGEDQGEAMELDSNSDDADEERALDAILEQSASVAPSTGAAVTQSTTVLDTLPEVWSGQINMPRENFDALMIDVSCKQIGGRILEPTSGYWQTLFPSPQARIDGRVPTVQSVKYLVSVRMNSSKELIVVTFIPRSDESKAKFNELIDFLLGKDRHALVFPWGAHPKPQAPGRELYLVPLLKDQPLPEFIELMDDHKFPRERTENALLGAFVLNKGKLMASAPTTTATPTIPAPVTTPLPTVPNIPMQIPSVANIPYPSAASPVSQLSSSHLPVATTPSVKIDQAALAAEVASLTPEQISLMLRHLSQSVPLPVPAASGAPAGQTPPVPAAMPPASTPTTSVPAYATSIPGVLPFPLQFPPANQNPAASGQFSPPRQFSPPHPSQRQYGERNYDDREDRDRHKEYGRDGYGGRGSPRGRGSDRGKRGHRGRGRPYHDDGGGRPAVAEGGWGGRGRGGGPR